MPGQEKTEDPTPRRYEESRSHGQVALSPEVNSAVVLLVGFITLQSSGPAAVSRLTDLMRSDFRQIANPDLTPLVIQQMALQSGLAAIELLAPIIGAIMLAGVAVNLAQTRFLFSIYRLRPDFSRINPLAGFGRIFSQRSLVELGKELAKVTLIGLVVYRGFVEQFPKLVTMSQAEPRIAAMTLAEAALAIGVQAGLAMLLLGAVDYLYQRRQYMAGIRMTHEEVKEEMRNNEGNPELRARIRQIQRQLTQGRSLPKVATADVVVTNPTHYAVAISYNALDMRAPRVVSKGRGFIAQQIRRLAAEAGVPIVENVPLAQALYRSVDIGREIPADLYQAVAQVLAYIYSLRRKS